MIYLNEVFTSIQGEGCRGGSQALFVRFQGCNLHCDFCDTAYSRNVKEISVINVTTLADLIVNYLFEYQINYIIFTGGEPFFQKENLGDLILIIDNTIKERKDVLFAKKIIYGIETNGSMSLSACRIPVDLWEQISLTISPKLNEGDPRQLHPDFYSFCFIKDHCFKEITLKLLFPYYLKYGKFYSNMIFDYYYVQPLDDISAFIWIDPYLMRCQEVVNHLNDYNSKWRLSVQLHKLLNVK